MVTQLLWKRVQQDPQKLARVSALLAPGTPQAIQKPLGIGWLDMQTHMALCKAVESLDPEGYPEFWRNVMLEFGKSGLMRGFFSLGSRSGTSGLLRRVHLAYSAQTRDLGGAHCVDCSDSSAVLELFEFPARDFVFGTYTNGFRGVFAAAIELSGSTKPKVTESKRDDRTGVCRFDLEWTNPG